MGTNGYPVRVLISHVDGFVSVDVKSLHSAAEAAARTAYLSQWAAAMGCSGYSYMPVPEGQAEAVAVALRARSNGNGQEDGYLARAANMARDRWASEPAMVRRVEKALELARGGAVRELGEGQWEVASQNGGGTYWVNGGCQCPDYTHSVLWCKHRIAVGLVVKARQLKAEAEGASTPSASGTTTSQEVVTQPQYTGESAEVQAGEEDGDWAAYLLDAADWYEMQEEGRAATRGML
jgi:hypothetical protein